MVAIYDGKKIDKKKTKYKGNQNKIMSKYPNTILSIIYKYIDNYDNLYTITSCYTNHDNYCSIIPMELITIKGKNEDDVCDELKENTKKYKKLWMILYELYNIVSHKHHGLDYVCGIFENFVKKYINYSVILSKKGKKKNKKETNMERDSFPKIKGIKNKDYYRCFHSCSMKYCDCDEDYEQDEIERISNYSEEEILDMMCEEIKKELSKYSNDNIIKLISSERNPFYCIELRKLKID